MPRFVQIRLIITLLCCLSLSIGAPIPQGIKVQRGFEIEFTNFTFKPLTFIKEKWSSLGRFGFSKGIQKRDLTSILKGISPPEPPAPAPVNEPPEEIRYFIQKPKVPPVPNPAIQNMRIPIKNSFGVINGLYTNIQVPPPNTNLEERPPELFLNGELPPRPTPLVLTAPISVVPIISSPPPVPAEPPAVPISEIPPTEGPLRKGSRFVKYLGSELVKMMSQFVANAKVQLSQINAPVTTPEPAPPPPSPTPAQIIFVPWKY